jgi:hypothetical protein
MARGLCRYGTFELRALAARQRASALELQVRRWSPFTEPGYAAAWTADGLAMVWCWDRSALDSRLLAAGLDPDRVSVIPESALRAPLEEGVRLVECTQGVEAQHWHGSSLLASRWWPAPPAPPDIQEFLQDLSGPPPEGTHALAPLPFALEHAPALTLSQPPGTALGGGRVESFAYAALCLALGLPALWMGAWEWQLRASGEKVRLELSQVSSASREQQAARALALQAASEWRVIADLQRFPGPLQQLSALASALPDTSGASLREWDFSEGKARALFAFPAPDVSGEEYVKAFERSGIFSNVAAVSQPDARQLGFVLPLVARAAVRGASAASP